MLEVRRIISSKKCSNAWLKLKDSGHGWFTVVVRIFLGGKEANLTQNNVIYLTAETTLILTVSRRTGLKY